jgi:hypothetical protein
MIIMGLLMFPFLKTFFDTFTNPTTGIMVVPGVGHIVCDADTIALAGAIPWLAPIITLIIAVYIIIKPEQHPEGEPPSDWRQPNE